MSSCDARKAPALFIFPRHQRSQQTKPKLFSRIAAMSSSKGKVNSDRSGEPEAAEKKLVVETVEYRSPAGADPGQVQEKKPVTVVHEVHGGDKGKFGDLKHD
ncbi:hypothetical protein HPP92_000203 [Vanilla planifolia]|uniref:Uncharacterized protein n=1 Tax=Vanilla planifolia TaxID=51239 RepID=A0A835S1M1_VANPL|nr:hypothetical protein HPP92_000203 [Vanilla planifolia]